MNNKKNLPIGVFDSGFGGISVLKALAALMPNENFKFFGDSQNAPYGTKTSKQVQKLSLDIVDRFVAEGVKAVVVACNTATSAAIKVLRAKYPDLIIVGIEPAVKPAVEHNKNAKVVVIATPLTLKRPKFNKLADQYKFQARKIYKLPAPDLVEYVEQGDINSPDLYHYLETILLPYSGKIDSIVLGCTHYPLAKKAIQDVAGKNVYIVDGGLGTAKQLRKQLVKHNLLTTNNGKGTVTFANSNPDPNEIVISKKLFLL